MSTRRGGEGGATVNISSAAGTTGSPHEYVQYAAAKAGIDILTLGLSKELASDGIRVNAVAPGIVRTGIHADAGKPHRPDEAAAASRSAAPESRRRSLRRSRFSSAPSRRTSPGPSTGWPAASDRTPGRPRAEPEQGAWWACAERERAAR